ncbi:MAG: metal ABC transporter permease [candidate division WOR-3 bacterium]
MIFEYKFIQLSVFSLILYSLLASIIGTFVVLRKTTYISGGISHAAFGGLGLGVFLSLNPILVAIPFTLIFTSIMFYLGKKFKIENDSTVSIIWSLGMSLGIILLNFKKGYTGYMLGYLFGNVLSINTFDIILLSVVLFFTILIFFFFMKEFIFISLDQEYSKIVGIKYNLFDTIFYLFATLGIVVMIKISGVIVNIIFLTIAPLITKNIFTNIYKIIFFNFLLNVFFSLTGLLLSYNLDFPSGPSIVIVSIVTFIIFKIFKNL